MKTKLEYILEEVSPSSELVNKKIKFEDFFLNIIFIKNMVDNNYISNYIRKIW